jgi:hypothetical protein
MAISAFEKRRTQHPEWRERVTLLPQPPFFVGVEERVHEVIASVFWDFERLLFNALVEALQQKNMSYMSCSNQFGIMKIREEAKRTHHEQVLRKVAAIVDSSVHGDEPINGHLVLDIWIVQIGIEHDDGKGEHKARV